MIIYAWPISRHPIASSCQPSIQRVRQNMNAPMKPPIMINVQIVLVMILPIFFFFSASAVGSAGAGGADLGCGAISTGTAACPSTGVSAAGAGRAGGAGASTIGSGSAGVYAWTMLCINSLHSFFPRFNAVSTSHHNYRTSSFPPEMFTGCLTTLFVPDLINPLMYPLIQRPLF